MAMGIVRGIANNTCRLCKVGDVVKVKNSDDRFVIRYIHDGMYIMMLDSDIIYGCLYANDNEIERVY